MRFVALIAIVLGLTGLAFPPASIMPAAAQEQADFPPLPRPRPDRNAAETPEQPAPSAQTSEATEAIAALTRVPQPVSLTARITGEGMPIPSGLIWRVFEAMPDANGELALVAKTESGNASLELPPGEYVVHLAYGRAQISENLSVEPGGNHLDIVLEAGALRLNSAVTGDIAISPSLLKFDILTTGPGAERAVVAENIPPNEIVTLNAGTYQVVSHFGQINAVVRADLRVEPGQLTDATLYHHAAEVSFKLVSEAGGEAIADVEWTVKSADGTTVFTERGAFPSAVLSEGEYLVFAKLGDQVYNREVDVRPGAQREIEVLTSIY